MLLIFLVGKTSSGKDTIANYIHNKYNIESVCSYTTRPKRDYEENGVQHYFISDDEMNRIEELPSVIAWTRNDKTMIRYCATTDCIKGDTAVYIINPEGIEWFKEFGTKVDFKSIYIELDEDIIKKRALDRGDDINVLEKRLSSERDEFDSYRDSKAYDYIIDTDISMQDMYNKVDEIMKEVLDVSETK